MAEGPRAHDDAAVVRAEYASDERLAARRAAYADIEGPSAHDAVFEAVAEARPASVLEVGCGRGELAERLAGALPAALVAIDSSPRMVELTRARGVDARLAAIEALPFEEGSFDCVVAAWVLYHLPDLERGLREIHRVLRPGGRLVAATNGRDHLREVWTLAGDPDHGDGLPFRAEEAPEALAAVFASVECRPIEAVVVFPDAGAVRAYVEASFDPQRAHRLPHFAGPLRARVRNAVLVATRA